MTIIRAKLNRRPMSALETHTPCSIAVVIPSYRVTKHILAVIEGIGPEVSKIYVVDDCCPDKSGELVRNECRDPRVCVLTHQQNQGVGGAVMTGYKQALADGYDVAVKVDGDGQMDPALIPRFVQPIADGYADYTKGNRFFDLESLQSMPGLRLFGNAVLSFITKASSGYWDVMDPTNGYTAIHTKVVGMLPLEKIDRRYFFESDMLFRLNTVRAVVREIPMDAVYGDEKSNLKISKVAVEFPRKHLNRFSKRIFYNYFLRDFNVCTLELLFGSWMLIWGFLYGSINWYSSYRSGVQAPTGTVMLSVLPIILGFQLVLAAISYDINNIPRRTLHRLMVRGRSNA